MSETLKFRQKTPASAPLIRYLINAFTVKSRYPEVDVAILLQVQIT